MDTTTNDDEFSNIKSDEPNKLITGNDVNNLYLYYIYTSSYYRKESVAVRSSP